MLDAEGARRLAHEHPWMYHVLVRADDRSRETVASDGLASGRSRRYWHPLYKPRAGHVYLATSLEYLYKCQWSTPYAGDDIYAVSTSALVAARVNPDEDQFACDDRVAACDGFRLPRPPDMELWNAFGSDFVPSYGDWAEQVDLGSDPSHVVHSATMGSVAYAGVVPPLALRWWDPGARVWADATRATELAVA